MNNLPLDISMNIFLFLDENDLKNCSLANKNISYNYLNCNFWKKFSNLHHPYLIVNCKNDYYTKNPYFVTLKEYNKYVSNNMDWIEKYGAEKIRNIIILNIKYNKLRLLKEQNSDLSMDWKICINKVMENNVELNEYFFSIL
jgi:hypothetical protein